MNCLFCNGDMERGFIQSGRLILWTNKPHKITLYPKNKKEFLVAKNALGGASVQGFCCNKCQAIVLKY